MNWVVSHHLQLFSPFYHKKRKRRRKIPFAWGNQSSPRGQKLYPLAVSGMKSFRVRLPRRCDPAILSLTWLHCTTHWGVLKPAAFLPRTPLVWGPTGRKAPIRTQVPRLPACRRLQSGGLFLQDRSDPILVPLNPKALQSFEGHLSGSPETSHLWTISLSP